MTDDTPTLRAAAEALIALFPPEGAMRTFFHDSPTIEALRAALAAEPPAMDCSLCNNTGTITTRGSQGCYGFGMHPCPMCGWRKPGTEKAAEPPQPPSDDEGEYTYCAFCGHQTPRSHESAWEQIQEHVKSCEKHPMRDAEARIADLEARYQLALDATVGASQRAEKAEKRIAELEAENDRFRKENETLCVHGAEPTDEEWQRLRARITELEAAAKNELRALQAFTNRPGVKWGDVAAEIDRRLDALDAVRDEAAAKPPSDHYEEARFREARR